MTGISVFSRKNGKPSVSRETKIKYLWAYLFIAPQFIFFVGLTAFPIVMSYIYSFFQWNGLGALNHFVGFENYVRLIHDGQFWSDFAHSMEYMVGHTIVVLPFALIMAIVLNQTRIRGKVFYRTLYFLPVVTTTAIVGIIMANIFGDNDALINSLLMHFHIVSKPIGWLDHSRLGMIILILVGSWKFFGIVMIYWLAGLQSISVQLYEAAKMDGAGFWASLRYITFPILKPVSAVILLLTVVNGLHAFDLIQTMTGGGPYFGTETVDIFVYRYAFSPTGGFPQMGFASSAGILFGLAVFVISISIGLLIRRVSRD